MSASALRPFLPVIAAVIFALGVQRGSAHAAEPMVLPVDPVPLVVERAGQTVAEINIEIANEPAERQRGLMHRARLADGHGMLFIFEGPRQVTMWLRDTPESLDMVFVDQQAIVTRIEDNTEPLSDAIIASGGPALYVLELAAGQAAELDIRPGDMMRHPAISGN